MLNIFDLLKDELEQIRISVRHQIEFERLLVHEKQTKKAELRQHSNPMTSNLVLIQLQITKWLGAIVSIELDRELGNDLSPKKTSGVDQI